MNLFVEMHALQNFAPCNLNRDDTGAPKDAFFGGRRRARISSQCLKRAVREFFSAEATQGVLDANALGIRTKRLQEQVALLLIEKGRDRQESLDKTGLAFKSVKLALRDAGKTEYLLFLGKRQIVRVGQAIDENWDQIVARESPHDEGDKKKGKADKKKGGKTLPEEARKAMLAAMDGGKCLDIALFGRMLADMPEKNQDAACQMAHAISTHAVEREFDFYTAVDDLKPEDTAGADMMGTVEFNSACFYRYAVVDYAKLVANLQGDTELALAGVRALLKGFAVAEPTGKQNTFAAHNPPDYMLAVVRRGGAPWNLANAYEVPVRVRGEESLTGMSLRRLVDKYENLNTVYGEGGKGYYITTTGQGGTLGKRLPDLAGLVEAVAADVTEGV